MLIIGIDPGLTGAVATNTGIVHDIPIMAKGQGQAAAIKNHIDPVGLYTILWELSSAAPDTSQVVVYLERQYYRKRINPKTKQEIPQGGSGIFSLGDTYGLCRAYPPIMGIRVVTVMPAAWKKKLGLSADKEVCRAAAIEAFPNSYDSLKRKMDHNRAEALLIAKYGELIEGVKS